MTITVSSRREEHETACREQVRQILRNVQNLGLTMVKPVEPPSITHTDILMREVRDLSRELERVRTLTDISALAICTGILLGASALAGVVDIPVPAIAAIATVACGGTAALWACITFHLRNV
jgi:hypothetical protein